MDDGLGIEGVGEKNGGEAGYSEEGEELRGKSENK